jgi:tartrate-resistant acid phosphatase type 5
MWLQSYGGCSYIPSVLRSWLAKEKKTALHQEEFVYLPHLQSDSALIAWGAFFFRDLKRRPISRDDTIGLRSLPFTKQGELVCVELFDQNQKLLEQCFTEEENHIQICDLKPDTTYRYRVLLHEREWAKAPLDWVPKSGLQNGGHAYVNEFRTFPAGESQTPFSFAVIGDLGVGIKKGNHGKKCQYATSLALAEAFKKFNLRFIITTGDNIYHEGLRSGDVDDHWYFTYFQPYRYVINRIPVFPCIGNHDTAETKFESSDDRKEIYDNLYIRSRFQHVENSLDPGCFYTFRYGTSAEFICVDTSKNTWPFGKRMFQIEQHQKFLNHHFSPRPKNQWRIVFDHHPPFSAGPEHYKWGNSIQRELVPLWEQSGVSVVLSGHEHNFQYVEKNGVHYFLTGGGGKYKQSPPQKVKKIGTACWGGNNCCHFLVVRVQDKKMEVWPVCCVNEKGELQYLELHGEKTELPIVVTL